MVHVFGPRTDAPCRKLLNLLAPILKNIITPL
ncbi:hypothetical protein [Xenorhabdus hominickii]